MKTYTLITGASSGLGYDFAQAYAAQHCNLILLARRTDRLNALKQDLLQRYPIDVQVVTMDLSDAQQRHQGISDLIESYVIDRLINNAGFGYAASFEDMPHSIMLDMQRVNMEALSELCYLLIPTMKARAKGEIMNVASVAGFVSGPYMAEYYATKAYVVSLSQALHHELKPFNIKVSALCPGPTHTEFFHVARNALSPLKERLTMSSPAVVKQAIKDLEKNRVFSIPGFSNQSLVVLLKFLPRTLAAVAVSRFQSPNPKGSGDDV
jgi:uncharacterized protein